MANWDPEPVFIDGRYISEGHVVRRRRQARSSRRCTTTSAAPPSSTAPRSTGCARRTSASSSHVDGISPAWPVTLRRLRAVLHEGRVALPGARQPRRGPDRGPLEQAVPVAGGLARAAHPAAVRRPGSPAATTRSHAPCGILLDEADRAKSACIRCTWCDGYPCLVHAKSDAETIAVRPVLDLPNVTLLVDAEVLKLETDAVRADRHRASSSRAAATRRPTRPTSSSSSAGRVEQRQDPAALGERPAPERAGQRLRPGRSELHVPQQQGRRRARRRSSTRRSSRRRSASTTSTSAPTTTSGRSATSRWSASPTPRR